MKTKAAFSTISTPLIRWSNFSTVSPQPSFFRFENMRAFSPSLRGSVRRPGTDSTERHTNRERRFSDGFSDTDDSDGSRESRNLERARRFQKQVAALLLQVPINTGVATCDGDTTDGFRPKALTTPGAPDDITRNKKGGTVPRPPALNCALRQALSSVRGGEGEVKTTGDRRYERVR